MIPNDETKISRLIQVVKTNYPKLSYHCSDHGIAVWNVARNFGMSSRLDYDDRLALESAALLHDFYVVPGQDGKNEIRSGRFARKYLHSLGFSDEVCKKAQRLILATTMPQKPQDNLEGLMCDADLSSLGSMDYPLWQDRLRREWNKPEDKAWYELQLRFLSSHNYHTETARRLLGDQKEKNLESIRGKLKTYERAA